MPGLEIGGRSPPYESPTIQGTQGPTISLGLRTIRRVRCADPTDRSMSQAIRYHKAIVAWGARSGDVNAGQVAYRPRLSLPRPSQGPADIVGGESAPTHRPGRSGAWKSEPAIGTRPSFAAQSRQRRPSRASRPGRRPRWRRGRRREFGRSISQIVGRVGQARNAAGAADQGDGSAPGEPGLGDLAGPSSPR